MHIQTRVAGPVLENLASTFMFEPLNLPDRPPIAPIAPIAAGSLVKIGLGPRPLALPFHQHLQAAVDTSSLVLAGCYVQACFGTCTSRLLLECVYQTPCTVYVPPLGYWQGSCLPMYVLYVLLHGCMWAGIPSVSSSKFPLQSPNRPPILPFFRPWPSAPESRCCQPRFVVHSHPPTTPLPPAINDKTHGR